MQGQEHLQLLLTERGWKRETVHANTICPRPTKNLQTKTPRFKFVKSWIKLRTRCRIADDAIRKLWRNPTISGPAAGRANRQQPATHQFVRPLRHRRFVAGRFLSAVPWICMSARPMRGAPCAAPIRPLLASSSSHAAVACWAAEFGRGSCSSFAGACVCAQPTNSLVLCPVSYVHVQSGQVS